MPVDPTDDAARTATESTSSMPSRSISSSRAAATSRARLACPRAVDAGLVLVTRRSPPVRPAPDSGHGSAPSFRSIVAEQAVVRDHGTSVDMGR